MDIDPRKNQESRKMIVAINEVTFITFLQRHHDAIRQASPTLILYRDHIARHIYKISP